MPLKPTTNGRALSTDTRQVKEVCLLLQVRNAEDVPPFIVTYELLMVTLNPELDLRGNIIYTTQFIREDVLQFIIAARDL